MHSLMSMWMRSTTGLWMRTAAIAKLLLHHLLQHICRENTFDCIALMPWGRYSRFISNECHDWVFVLNVVDFTLAIVNRFPARSVRWEIEPMTLWPSDGTGILLLQLAVLITLHWQKADKRGKPLHNIKYFIVFLFLSQTNANAVSHWP